MIEKVGIDGDLGRTGDSPAVAETGGKRIELAIAETKEERKRLLPLSICYAVPAATDSSCSIACRTSSAVRFLFIR